MKKRPQVDEMETNSRKVEVRKVGKRKSIMLTRESRRGRKNLND